MVRRGVLAQCYIGDCRFARKTPDIQVAYRVSIEHFSSAHQPHVTELG